MSADDATARWLDEQLDLALATGQLPDELDGTELGQVIQLFADDAADLASERMPDAMGVRRRLLEQVGDEQAAAPGLARSVLRGTGRSAGWSIGRAWRARRVAMVAGCFVVLCTTLAYADTHTPAGRAVRTAARTLQIPVPAEPKRHEPSRPATDDAPAPGSSAPSKGGDERLVEPGPDAQREPGVMPAEPRVERDGEFDPGEQPLPPMDGRPHDGGPRPDGQFEPGTQPLPQDPNNPGPQPQPKPPIGQQPPPGGQLPPPNGTQPIAPKPGGTAPAPGGTAPPPGGMQPPPPGPGPAPAPQPAPQPAP